MKKTMQINFTEENGYLAYKDDSVKTILGSTKMLAVGGGVKAKLGKNKEGQPIVETYFFDKDRFSKETAEKWIMKHKDNIEESLKRVQENAPSGSFQDITMRLQMAIDNFSAFGTDDPYSARPYVMYVFPDYCIVSMQDEYWQVTYSDSNGSLQLGQPKKVEMAFVVKESAVLNEKLNRLAKANTEIQDEFVKFKITEASIDASTKTFTAVLIEAGANYSKKRHYPLSTIQESAPLFVGLKMFANHPTDQEERTRPERDIKDWVATIVESWYEDGKAMGKIHVHDKQLLENMQDAVYREHIGLSINASGRRYMKTIDGVQMEVIEKIISPKSVDFVTEPGARGRVEGIAESNKEKEMEITVKNLRENYSSVVKEIEDGVVATLQEKNSADMNALKERAEKAENELKSIKEQEAKNVFMAKVSKILTESKLPKKSIERISESIAFNAEMTDEVLTKTVNDAITKEREYVKEVAGIKIGVDAGAVSVGSDKLTEGLEKSLGL